MRLIDSTKTQLNGVDVERQSRARSMAGMTAPRQKGLERKLKEQPGT